MKKSAANLALAVVLVVAAVFLLSSCSRNERKIETKEMPTPQKQPEAVVYTQKIEYIQEKRQVINILEVNLLNKKVEVLPVLSHDSIFGFETTSSIAQRKHAFAAVNGGFFYSYGQPSGLLIINDKLLCTATELTKRPVFAVSKNRKFIMEDMDIQVFLNIGDTTILIDGVNRDLDQNEVIAFTSEYGLTTRLNGRPVWNIVIENGTIQDFIMSDEQVRIPRQGMVIAVTGKRAEELRYLLKKLGEKAEISYNIVSNTEKIAQALEGGFWVIKNGEKVVKGEEPWVGLMTNREPRTVVGIKDNHIAVFITIDGRQPKYSIGLTGNELAEYLLSMNIKDALMLDGGASTTMVLEGKIINQPSYRGRERMIGGAIIIKIDK
ncbi:MAG: phosphodiester glycosidase family protein [Clostridia bacterium]